MRVFSIEYVGLRVTGWLISSLAWVVEERQESNQKRRKVEEYRRAHGGQNPPEVKAKEPEGIQINGETLVQVVNLQPSTSSVHASLPARPGFSTVPVLETDKAKAARAIGGSNNELVKNRRDIRMANMSAAEVLKAELAGSSAPLAEVPSEADGAEDRTEMRAASKGEPISTAMVTAEESDTESTRGTKRKVEDDENLIDAELEAAEEDEAPDVAELTSVPHMDRPVEKPKARKVNPDGTVDVEDTVKFVFLFCFLKLLGCSAGC